MELVEDLGFVLPKFLRYCRMVDINSQHTPGVGAGPYRPAELCVNEVRIEVVRKRL